jgi:hypothetical protein
MPNIEALADGLSKKNFFKAFAIYFHISGTNVTPDDTELNPNVIICSILIDMSNDVF